MVGSWTHHVMDAVSSPGSRSTPLVLALDAAKTIRTHTILDERTAGFVALGLARARGRPVVLACTSGSAGAHYAPAVIEAYESGVPLLVCTADRPSELHGYASAQTTEQRGFFENHCVARFSVDAAAPPDELYAAATKGLGQALRRPGPVHFNVAFREPLWRPGTPYVLRAGATFEGDLPKESGGRLEAIARLTALCRSTHRGVLVVGPRSRQDRLEDDPALAKACARAATALRWPLLADALSGVRARGCGENVVSGYDSLLRSEYFRDHHRPDIALWIGRPATSKTLNRWLAAQSTPVVTLSTSTRHREADWNVVEAIEDDPASFLETFAYRLNEAGLSDRPMRPGLCADGDGWLNLWAQAQARFRTASATDGGFWEGALAREVVAALPAGALLHVASSMPVRDVDAFAGLLDVTITSNRGVNGIDGSLATLLGHCLAWRKGPSVLLVGDLAFLHDISSLRELVRMQANATVLLVNNGGGHIFDHLPIVEHHGAFERYFLTPQHADFQTLVSGFGARYQRLSPIALKDGLRGVVTHAIQSPGVDVLEVAFDRAKNLESRQAFHDAVCEVAS